MVMLQCLGDLNIVIFLIILISPLFPSILLRNDSPSLAFQDGIDSFILSVWNELIVSVLSMLDSSLIVVVGWPLRNP